MEVSRKLPNFTSSVPGAEFLRRTFGLGLGLGCGEGFGEGTGEGAMMTASEIVE